MFKARNLFWVLALTALWGTASVGQTPPAQRNVYYVSVTGKDSNSGRSLQRAFQTIQRGIQAASAGDIVWVTEGIYAGPGNKNLGFGGRAITVKSTAGPDYTVIDCQNSGRGFVFQSGETRQSVLDGFTVIKELRSSPRYAALSIIVLTTVIEDASRRRYELETGLAMDVQGDV